MTENSGKPAKPHLFVIGLGVNIPDHTTIEASRAMASCARIYSIVQEPPSVWLPKDAALNSKVINLLDSYREGVLRTDNYDRAAGTIIDALSETKPVGYVTYGNPMAYDSVAQSVVRQAERSGIPFRVIPGISSIDTLLCDLGLDMAPGLQIYEASWLVDAQITLRTDVAAVLLQISAFGSFRAHVRTPPLGAALAGLVEYLTRSYPPTHRVSIVRSSAQADGSGKVRVMEIGKLREAATEDLLNASMYVPVSKHLKLDPRGASTMQAYGPS